MSKAELSIQRLSIEDLERELRTFERVHEHATGERLGSEEFFARFCRGEFDSLFGHEWADYWRAYLRARA